MILMVLAISSHLFLPESATHVGKIDIQMWQDKGSPLYILCPYILFPPKQVASLNQPYDRDIEWSIGIKSIENSYFVLQK